MNTAKLRKCMADGQAALFHCWNTVSYVVPPSPMIGGRPGGTVAYTLGIVEFEDGSIRQVRPEQIIFTDRAND